MLSKKVQEAINEVVKQYDLPEGALLPVLQVVHQEPGYLNKKVLLDVAEMLDIPAAKVKGIASFYFPNGHKTMGRHVIKVCTSLCCMVSDSEKIVDILKDQYNLVFGNRTEDGRFSLIATECIGACCSAPAMFVDNNLYENLTKDKVLEVLESYR